MSLILTEVRQKVGVITLNSETTLNSLSLPMIDELQAVLTAWKTDDAISCIWLQGAGEKAFCAGGDVRRLHDAIVAQQEIDATKAPQDCLDFFCREYQVDYAIHTYPKPVIVWGHGIVMGGGIGLMAGASHRIVTEKSKLAMPEITIGLFPDVGGTWFLNKMPSAYGLYLGLTGTRLDGADCIYLGLADHYISSGAKAELLDTLQNIEWSNDDKECKRTVTTLLERVSRDREMPPSQAAAHRGFVQKFERVQTLEEWISILYHYPVKDDWINAGIKSFEAGSPSAAYVIFRQLQEGRNVSLEDVFRNELNLACQCCIYPDFAEGVRALLIDKDQAPKWHPATLSDMTSTWIDNYFTPLWPAEEHPLKDLEKD